MIKQIRCISDNSFPTENDRIYSLLYFRERLISLAIRLAEEAFESFKPLLIEEKKKLDSALALERVATYEVGKNVMAESLKIISNAELKALDDDVKNQLGNDVLGTAKKYLDPALRVKDVTDSDCFLTRKVTQGVSRKTKAG